MLDIMDLILLKYLQHSTVLFSVRCVLFYQRQFVAVPTDQQNLHSKTSPPAVQQHSSVTNTLEYWRAPTNNTLTCTN